MVWAVGTGLLVDVLWTDLRGKDDGQAEGQMALG